MKLSIEEKAKAYDEAIEKIQKYVKDDFGCTRLRPEDIFSELKESESEMIRKRIIALVNAYGQGMYKGEMLAWLEKQDKQKPFNYENINIQQNDFAPKSALEAINEEKVDNANKVELKFKVGDWITNGVYTCKIVEVIDNSYKYTFPEGASYLGVIDDMDKEYRLWTIDDAKDGDVLATEDAVFIFKHIDKTGLSLCKSYCEVIGNSELGLGFDFSINGVYPASKEQRELLHSKIKEACYEWDAEKFELKKIKSEFWSDDVEKILNGFYINSDADIRGVQTLPNISNNYNVFATEKQAKSALAMARISQIMANDVENFGGVITYEEWKKTEKKFAICRSGSYICKMFTIHDYYFLAFHTAKQRDLFLKKYPQLVKDYLMIPYLMIPEE